VQSYRHVMYGKTMDNIEILKAKKSGDVYIILAHLPNNSVTPWATWVSETITGEKRWSGRYFTDEIDAHPDFDGRR